MKILYYKNCIIFNTIEINVTPNMTVLELKNILAPIVNTDIKFIKLRNIGSTSNINTTYIESIIDLNNEKMLSMYNIDNTSYIRCDINTLTNEEIISTINDLYIKNLHNK